MNLVRFYYFFLSGDAKDGISGFGRKKMMDVDSETARFKPPNLDRKPNMSSSSVLVCQSQEFKWLKAMSLTPSIGLNKFRIQICHNNPPVKLCNGSSLLSCCHSANFMLTSSRFKVRSILKRKDRIQVFDAVEYMRSVVFCQCGRRSTRATSFKLITC